MSTPLPRSLTESDAEMRRNRLHKMLVKIGQITPREHIDSKSHEFAEAAHYDPQHLAAILKISLRQLERRFRSEFQCTPREWLNEIRMTHACFLLIELDSIKEVAFQLSFKQPSHFTREFKLYYGITPSLFRQMTDEQTVAANFKALRTR